MGVWSNRKICRRKFSGTTSDAVSPREKRNAQLSRAAAADGIVLLKNEGAVLPLQAGASVALYGSGVTQTIKGGTGSGDVNNRNTVNFLEGMREAGYKVTDEDWLDAYEKEYRQARLAWRDGILRRINDPVHPEDFFDAYSKTPFVRPAGGEITKTGADTAVYVLSRIAGENADRLDAPGDYLLTVEEHAHLSRICALYPHVILVLNVGGVIDLSFLDELPQIQAVLLAGQGGIECGAAIADVISGKVNPSGKLTDTWAYRYEDYPSSATFSHNNGNLEKEYYSEGIFVGYRYFDTFDVPVRYGFGYGLSYTTFELGTPVIGVLEATVDNEGYMDDEFAADGGNGAANGVAGDFDFGDEADGEEADESGDVDFEELDFEEEEFDETGSEDEDGLDFVEAEELDDAALAGAAATVAAAAGDAAALAAAVDAELDPVPDDEETGIGEGISRDDVELQVDSDNPDAGPGDEAVDLCMDYGSVVYVKVPVRNTGSRAGREVVQLYASAPYGRLPKERRRLIGFAKTGLLQPGEDETVEISVPTAAMTSYDEEQSAWILEQGWYTLWVGSSLESSKQAGALKVTEEIVVEQDEPVCERRDELTELVPDQAEAKADYERRAALYERLEALDGGVDGAAAAGAVAGGMDRSAGSGAVGNGAASAAADDAIAAVASAAAGVDGVTDASYIQVETLSPDAIFYTEVIYDSNTLNADPDCLKVARDLTDEQLIGLVRGAERVVIAGQLGDAGQSVPGTAGETSHAAIEDGIAPIVLSDGPAGLRVLPTYSVKDGKVVRESSLRNMDNGFFYTEPAPEADEVYHQYATAFPVGTVLAQTWDRDLVADVGNAVAEEMKEFGVTLWLAPGMNIHRNPLCGRNFEYYSEDPVLSGRMAATITNGVQGIEGCGTTIKHFAANNQEDNRMRVDEVISERALREIYFKGFEIAVKESHPMALMTSYNLINGVHSANNYDLCTKIARDEWGFDGVIMTDWTTTTSDGGKCTASGCIRSGNDLIMPGFDADSDNLRAELAAGTLKRAELEACASRIIRCIGQSDCYE